MKQKIFIFMCLPLLFVACGKKEGENIASTQAAAASTPLPGNYPGTYFPPITGSNGYYYVSYKFWENGCGTGRQEFYGHDSETVRQRLCAGLQLTWENRGCALGMRQAYFSSMCTGISWNPR